MHPGISAWPSAYFYASQLKDAPAVLGDARSAPFHQNPCFSPLAFFDCRCCQLFIAVHVFMTWSTAFEILIMESFEKRLPMFVIVCLPVLMDGGMSKTGKVGRPGAVAWKAVRQLRYATLQKSIWRARSLRVQYLAESMQHLNAIFRWANHCCIQELSES